MTSNPTSRSTIHILSRREEEDATKEWKQNSLNLCAPIIQEFAECARGRTVTVVWACRKQSKAMNTCLHQYSTQEYRDKIRQKFIDKKAAAQKETQPSLYPTGPIS